MYLIISSFDVPKYSGLNDSLFDAFFYDETCQQIIIPVALLPETGSPRPDLRIKKVRVIWGVRVGNSSVGGKLPDFYLPRASV